MGSDKIRKSARPTALLAAGVIAGAVGAGTLAANAASSPSPSATSSPGSSYAATPDGRGGHPAETPLTGTTKSKVEAAVLAKYPNAKTEPTETDSDGVYESHITTASGQQVTVEVDKSYAVTGTETHG